MLGRKRPYSERPRRFELDQRGFAWMQTGLAQCAHSDQAARFDTQRMATCKVDANTLGVSHALSQFQTGEFGLIKATRALPFAAVAKTATSSNSAQSPSGCIPA